MGWFGTGKPGAGQSQHQVQKVKNEHGPKTLANADFFRVGFRENRRKGVILASASIVDHGATVGDYVHLAAGAMVQKGAKVPDGIKVSSGTIY